MKAAAFRVCSGIAFIENRTFTEPAVFPAGMMDENGIFVANNMTSSLTPEEKKELPCFGVPPSDTIAAETIAMGQCDGACLAAVYVEQSWCDIPDVGEVPSGWTANNFSKTRALGTCDTCECKNSVFKCWDVPCGDSPELIRSARIDHIANLRTWMCPEDAPNAFAPEIFPDWGRSSCCSNCPNVTNEKECGQWMKNVTMGVCPEKNVTMCPGHATLRENPDGTSFDNLMWMKQFECADFDTPERSGGAGLDRQRS